MTPWYIAIKPFNPDLNNEEWARYIEESGLHQLRELVTLDHILCPPILSEVKAEYWSHIVNEDYMLDFFTDLEFMLNEVRHVQHKSVLCVYRNPESTPSPPDSGTWSFAGYDLVDVLGGISALTNCGANAFPKAFSSDELSPLGLLPSLERAREAQRSLREHYPREDHADCHVWALYRSAA